MAPPLPPFGPKRILLVEDNPGDARLIREMLRDAAGSETHLEWRDHLSEIHSVLKNEHIDLLILDLGLPDAYGMEAMVVIRDLATVLPVVVLTGLDDQRLAHRALVEGAQDYLVKGRITSEILIRALSYSMDRHRREAALRASEAKIRRMLDSNLIGIAFTGGDGAILEANGVFFAMLGLRPGEPLPGNLQWDRVVAPQRLEDHLANLDMARRGQETAPWETDLLRPDGTLLPVLIGAAPLDGLPEEMVTFAMDISERRARMEQLHREARMDPLTGLHNRRSFLEHLERAIAASHRYGHPLSLCICDLDHFKHVNDSYGHALGDEVLRAFGRVLQEALREDDVSARFGGDEFCILFAHSPAWEALESLERIRTLFAAKRFRADREHWVQLSATFGLVELRSEWFDEGALLEAADQALYRAKRAGRNRVELAP